MSNPLNPVSISAPEAYERLLPVFMAMPESQLVRINIDVPRVVTTVLGAQRELLRLRPLLVGLPDFDVVELDELELKARAASHAHALYVAATDSPSTPQELLERCTELRDRLYSDALVLVRRKLLDAKPLREVKRRTGHRELAVDLQVLAATIRSVWSILQGRTLVTAEELDEAVRLADELNGVVGQRDQGQPGVLEARAIRHRAFSLLVRC